MVDMRGDGEVCSEGFEYNWAFRSRDKGWRAYPGHASMGGWVRRRRWLRLMMRPADARLEEAGTKADATEEPEVTQDGPPVDGDTARRRNTIVEEMKTWQGDAVADWDRCHRLLRSTNRDGRRLELWADWLGVGQTAEAKGPANEDYLTSSSAAADQPGAEEIRRQKDAVPTIHVDPQLSPASPTENETGAEDAFYTPMPIPVVAEERDWIITVLREHVRSSQTFNVAVPNTTINHRATRSSRSSYFPTLARTSSNY